MAGLISEAMVRANSMAVDRKPLGSVRSNVARPVIVDADTSIFTLIVTRLTANIAQNLPMPVFAALHDASGYTSFLQGILPAGVTITGQNGLYHNASQALHIGGITDITFSDGVGTDTLQLTCQQINYKVLLSALLSDSIKAHTVKLSVPTGQEAQFAAPIFIIRATGYGYDSKDSITPETHVDQYQQLGNIVTIGKNSLTPINFPPFSRDQGLGVMMSPVVGLSMTMTFSLSERFLQTT